MPYFACDDHRLFYRDAGQGPPVLIRPGDTASSAWSQPDEFRRHVDAFRGGLER